MAATSGSSLTQLEPGERTLSEYFACTLFAGMCFAFLVVVHVCLCACTEGRRIRLARPTGMGATNLPVAPANHPRARNIPRRRLHRSAYAPTEDGYGPHINYDGAPPTYTLGHIPSSTSGQSQRRQRRAYADFETVQSQDEAPPPPYAP